MAWMVFRDPALAYAMVAVGALVPDLVDLAAGGVGPGHSIVVGGGLLGVVMLGTRGRRRLRRRMLGLPLGFLFHLVLDGAWLEGPERLWWPLAGSTLRGNLPSIGRPTVVILAMEIAGVVLGWLAWRAIGSARSARREVEPRTPSTGDL
ncbi:MAG TPA: hypothetical protein VMY88_00770 [Acidimicrobiales bacterium]|nr:hypothetical protein [Acidimicrobiales bacterium]